MCIIYLNVWREDGEGHCNNYLVPGGYEGEVNDNNNTLII